MHVYETRLARMMLEAAEEHDEEPTHEDVATLRAEYWDQEPEVVSGPGIIVSMP
jgi:hypothetical protein